MSSTYTDEELKQAVAKSLSLADVMRKLGLVPAGGNYRTIKKGISKLKLCTSHFTGQGHLRGKTHGWAKKIPLSEILVENSTYTNSSRLKDRLIQAGILERVCYSCRMTTWLGKPMPLELEHKNGNPLDHRLENLSLLCPNCHSFTSTYRGGNQKRKNGKILRGRKRRVRRNLCVDCCVEISRRASRCRSCASKLQKRKVEKRPDHDTLLSEVNTIGYRAAGRKYGVSDQAIRKWLR